MLKSIRVQLEHTRFEYVKIHYSSAEHRIQVLSILKSKIIAYF